MHQLSSAHYRSPRCAAHARPSPVRFTVAPSSGRYSVDELPSVVAPRLAAWELASQPARCPVSRSILAGQSKTSAIKAAKRSDYYGEGRTEGRWDGREGLSDDENEREVGDVLDVDVV